MVLGALGVLVREGKQQLADGEISREIYELFLEGLMGVGGLLLAGEVLEDEGENRWRFIVQPKPLCKTKHPRVVGHFVIGGVHI